MMRGGFAVQWRDVWEKWWPDKKSERTGIPLTDQQRKAISYLLILVVGAAIVMQFTSKKAPFSVVSFQDTKPVLSQEVEPVASPSPSMTSSFEEVMEKRLAGILTQIEGVGNVQVMVSVATGSRLEVARDINGDKTITEETDKQGGKRRVVAERQNEKVVILREGQGAWDKPMILAEHRPVIIGVLVVAEGAQDPGIRLRIGRAVEIAMGIPAHRVTVVPKKIR